MRWNIFRQGNFDGWTEGDLLRFGKYSYNIINNFKNNVKNIKLELTYYTELSLPKVSLHTLYENIVITACNIRDEIDAILKDSLSPEISSLQSKMSGTDDINTVAKIKNLQKIQGALTEIQGYAVELVKRCSCYYEQSEMSYMLGALQITNVYDRIKNTLSCIQIRIEDLRNETKAGIERMEWLIPVYERDQYIDEDAKDVCRMYYDLIDIKPELTNIYDLVTKLIYS